MLPLFRIHPEFDLSKNIDEADEDNWGSMFNRMANFYASSIVYYKVNMDQDLSVHDRDGEADSKSDEDW